MAWKLVGSSHIRTLTHPRCSSLCFFLPASSSRRLHQSAYEKDVEEVGGIISSDKPEEEYWEPDPDTGVFVPASEHNSEESVVTSTTTTEETVFDEKVFFRPLADLEPPQPESFTGEIPPGDPFAD